jgi:hypothetical protein
MAAKTFKINEYNKLKSYFGSLFDKTNKDVMAAARHGVSEAINHIKSQVTQNALSSPFRSTSSTHYPVPLIEGIKAYLYRGVATGFVDVLGNTKHNDGTWRLRFFEVGATRRNRGVIQAYHFLQNAATTAESTASALIQSAIENKINELNK